MFATKKTERLAKEANVLGKMRLKSNVKRRTRAQRLEAEPEHTEAKPFSKIESTRRRTTFREAFQHDLLERFKKEEKENIPLNQEQEAETKKNV